MISDFFLGSTLDRIKPMAEVAIATRLAAEPGWHAARISDSKTEGGEPATVIEVGAVAWWGIPLMPSELPDPERTRRAVLWANDPERKPKDMPPNPFGRSNPVCLVPIDGSGQRFDRDGANVFVFGPEMSRDDAFDRTHEWVMSILWPKGNG